MLEHLIPDVAGALGVEPTTALLGVGVVMTGANILGKVIPDDKKGVLGVIRKVAKVVGAYVPNTVHKGVSVTDVARDIVTRELAEEIDERLPEVVKAFPGLPTTEEVVEDIITKTGNRLRGPDGKFIKGE